MDVIMGAVETMPSLTGLSNSIGDALTAALNNTVGRVLYIIVSAISWLFSLVFQIFEAFSGQIKVSYKGEANYLTNIFFENSTISGIYWGMAIIGVVLCFAFTIIAVIKKMFDGADKVQASLGAILGSMFRSLLVILSLNAAMVVVLNFTNVLMQRVVYVFNAGSSLTESQRIDFTEDQFATMGRVLNTIGNYSLNPSHNSRYNLNSCFNEVRGDLLYLQDQGVFEFYYLTEDENGEEIKTWQSELQTLVYAGNLKEELKMDVYNESVANALLDIMETLETNTNLYPLKYYERAPAPLDNIPLDRVLFLACTYNAALNEQFNINPSHTDPLRGPYYNGQKSIYDYDQVVKDFNLLWGFNYVVFFIIVYGIFKEALYILLDCVARIYNMVLLYLVGPPFIALSPLDGGGKTKQWMTAFVVQCFGVFGTVISMRLLMTFIPIIVSLDLQIFANPIMDILAKVLLIDAGFLTAKKASSMITGILADSAGWQSITAGSLRSDYDNRNKEDEAKKDRAENKQRQKEQDQKQREQERKQQQQQRQQMQQKQQQNAGGPKPPGSTLPKPQGTGQPNPQGNGQPNPQGNGQPNPQGNGQPNPQGNGQPKPQGNGQPKPKDTTTGTAPKTGGGVQGIPVAPDISTTSHYEPPAKQPDGENAPIKDPPPGRGDGGQGDENIGDVGNGNGDGNNQERFDGPVGQDDGGENPVANFGNDAGAGNNGDGNNGDGNNGDGNNDDGNNFERINIPDPQANMNEIPVIQQNNDVNVIAGGNVPENYGVVNGGGAQEQPAQPQQPTQEQEAPREPPPPQGNNENQ